MPAFPRISPDTQKARDNDRRRILEQELAAEQKSLEEARRDLNELLALPNSVERSNPRGLDRLQSFKAYPYTQL